MSVSSASVLSHLGCVATPWIVACHALLSMGFSRQAYWSGLPLPPPGIFPSQCLFSLSRLLHWQAGSLPLAPPDLLTALFNFQLEICNCVCNICLSALQGRNFPSKCITLCPNVPFPEFLFSAGFFVPTPNMDIMLAFYRLCLHNWTY